MKKPAEMTNCTTASALNRINNCLPLFSGGTEAIKFIPAELLEILECSLPYAWRQKFGFDGYIPTDGTRAFLIANCEAIEKNEEAPKKGKKEEKDKPDKKRVKFDKGKK